MIDPKLLWIVGAILVVAILAGYICGGEDDWP